MFIVLPMRGDYIYHNTLLTILNKKPEKVNDNISQLLRFILSFVAEIRLSLLNMVFFYYY